MRWKGREQSSNVEDRRGMSPRMAMGGGGGLIVVIVILLLRQLGAPPEVENLARQIVEQRQAGQQAASGPGVDDDAKEFISVVLADTEKVWSELFQAYGVRGGYREPKLVIYEDGTQTGCGFGSAEMGPFYCPRDQTIYIDPAFFNELAKRHKAPGDFAQAYVIAHEVAHHVQRLIGFSDPVDKARQSGNERLINQMSVRLELQADFLAGVWAHHANRQFDILEDGDVEEAIQAANQIGDDTLQREATGRVIPERFTHGTSHQRMKWFRRGQTSGRLEEASQLFDLAYEKL